MSEPNPIKINSINGELQVHFAKLCEEVRQKLPNRDRVMIMDIINHLNGRDHLSDSGFKENYSNLMVALIVALRAGKSYCDEL
ncbi:MAG TPA: hypothetical protein VKK79_18380 [Candidatus Lokiarchaeia archaeon]|nr:hypothetical protein [Candidatus Lokiarchaeia archaeon]